MGRLSTHVLDTSRGRPAQGVAIDVHFIRGTGREMVTTAVTNDDGRTTAALLEGERLKAGVYELAFHVGEYFRRAGVQLPDPPFLDVIVIRVGVADSTGHYHVPLLLTPYGYSTYRGS